MSDGHSSITHAICLFVRLSFRPASNLMMAFVPVRTCIRTSTELWKIVKLEAASPWRPLLALIEAEWACGHIDALPRAANDGADGLSKTTPQHYYVRDYRA